MGVTDADGQGIRGVGGHPLFDAKQSLNHGADLLFARLSVTANRLLDLCGRIFVNRNPGEGSRQERHSSRLAKEQCGPGIPGEEHLLDGHVVGPELLKDVLEFRVDL